MNGVQQPTASASTSPPTSFACPFGAEDDPIGSNVVCPILEAAQAQPLMAGAALLLAIGALLPTLRARFGSAQVRPSRRSARGGASFHDLRQRATGSRDERKRSGRAGGGKTRRVARALEDDEDEDDDEDDYYP